MMNDAVERTKTMLNDLALSTMLKLRLRTTLQRAILQGLLRSTQSPEQNAHRRSNHHFPAEQAKPINAHHRILVWVDLPDQRRCASRRTIDHVRYAAMLFDET